MLRTYNTFGYISENCRTNNAENNKKYDNNKASTSRTKKNYTFCNNCKKNNHTIEERRK